MTEIRRVDNDVITVELLDDGILYCVYKPNLVIKDIATAKLTIESRKSVGGNIPRFVCTDIRNLVKVKPEASDYLGKPEAYDLISCLALVVKTRFHRMFVSFFLKFNKPPVPCQVFHKTEDALAWLRRRKLLEN